MYSLLNKKSVIWTIATLCLVLMVGCSSTPKPLSKSISNAKPTENASSKSPQQDNSQTTLLESIKKLAEQGKIINCDFPAKSTVIGNVKEKWGSPNKSVWVEEAKGVYDTYSKHNVVFGFNKGDQIFEVRSFDSRLAKISLSMVKKYFGTPAYDVKSNGEEIIGYTAGKEFKILYVFPLPTNGSNNCLLKHYSVFYPAGTVNMMADYPGRIW